MINHVFYLQLQTQVAACWFIPLRKNCYTMHVQSTIQIVELQTNPVCKRPFSPPCTIHPVLTSNPYDLLLNSLPGSWSLSFRIINVSGDAPCMLYLPAFGSYLIMFGQMLVEMSHARSLAQKNFYTITYHLWSFTNKH